jgi:hypothetical protein
VRVFYSWQSDTPGRTGRHFVREALAVAIAGLAEEVKEVDDAERPELDHDTKGVAGSPDLAPTILAKIDASDVFVADVTPVGRTPMGKALMNPNVAIELGYAVKAKGSEALLMVLNGAHGNREDLPFDLRHKRGPIVYTLADDADGAAVAAQGRQLVGALKVALRPYLETKAVAVPAVEPTPATFCPAAYFERGEPLVPAGADMRFRKGLQFTADRLLYLRLIPEVAMADLRERDAVDAVSHGLVGPLESGGGYSSGRNRFGGIVFNGNYEEGALKSTTQVFLNRELWGIDATILAHQVVMRNKTILSVIPPALVEQMFLESLREYSTFARDRLGVTPPVRVVAGATNVRDFYIPMDAGYIERFWGPVHRQHIEYAGTLNSWEDNEVDRVLLELFEMFFDACGRARPPGLNGFP